MILEMLLTLLKNLLNLLLVFKIPSLPDDALNYIETIFTYLESGASILANYTPLAYLLVLFGIIVAIDIAIGIYHFVMWILKKIPVISIS